MGRHERASLPNAVRTRRLRAGPLGRTAGVGLHEEATLRADQPQTACDKGGSLPAGSYYGGALAVRTGGAGDATHLSGAKVRTCASPTARDACWRVVAWQRDEPRPTHLIA